jgi:hypothetical protein
VLKIYTLGRIAHDVLIDVRASPIDESGSHSSIPTTPPS